MSSIGRTAIEKIPFPFLAFSFISGLWLMFASPIRFLLPSYLQYPLSSDPLDPAKTLGVFLIVAILSFGIGTIVHLFSPFLTGDGGLNQRLKDRFWRQREGNDARQEGEGQPEFREGEILDFVRWLVASRSAGYWDYLLTQREIIGALISTSEIAAMLSLLGAIASLISFLSPWVKIETALSFSGWSLILWALSFVGFLGFREFYRKLFSDYFNRVRRQIIQEFRATPKPLQ
jgi:hypothetical protein